MEIITKLKDQGWYLLDDGIKKLPEDVDKSDTRKIIQAAMDMDFREIAGGALPTDLSKKDETMSGRVVLQISKIRNIAAPKADEEHHGAPRFFQLELTDGVNQVQALEIENISALNFNTPPGTKIYLKCEKIPLMQGMLMLKSNDVQVLGGRVSHLLEKWEMSRTLLKYAKGGRVMNGGSSGPPPWTPFGQRIQQQNVSAGNDKNFKSLAAANEKEGKENNEFVAMRKEAIAEAAKAGSKKVFGGGNQPIVDHNVKKILEKGFTEEEAKHALRATGNNLEKALFNLKRREESKNKDDSRNSYDKSKSGVAMNDRSNLNSNKRGPNNNTRDNFSNKKGGKDDVVPTKPAGNVSLFDFLTDKLPSNPNETEKSSISTSQNQQHFGSSSNQQHSQPSSRHESRTERLSRPSDSYNSSRPSHYTSNSNNNNSQQQQSSSYSESRNQNSQQNQHHIPNSQSNRGSLGQKFENNLSSSFQANRNYSQDNERPRNRNNRESTERSGSSNNTGSNRNYQNSYQGRSGGNSGNDRQYDDQNSERYYNSRDQRNNNYNQRNTKSQQGNERDGGNRSGGNDRYQTSNTSHFQYHQHQNNSGSNYDNSRNSRNDNQSYRNGYENTRNSGASGSYQNKTNHSQISSSRYSQKDNTTNAYQQNQSQNQGPNNSRNYSDNRQQSYHQQQQSNQNSEAKVNKIIEETSKLKIDQQPQHQQQQQPQQQHSQKPRHNQNTGSHRNQNITYQQQPQQHNIASQHQPQIMTVVSHQGPPNQTQISQHTVQSSQQQQHPHFQPPIQVHSAQHSLQTGAFTQIPNGFAYDPNKIMGFQNKETNDFAMTLLKSQGIPTALTPTAALVPPQPPHPHPSVTPTAAPQSSTPHPAAAYQTMQIGHPPPPTLNQHSFAAPGPAFVMQPTSIAPPPQLATIGPQVAHTHTPVAGLAASLQGPPQQTPGAFNMNHCENWNWKVGDRCIAKYWDDGRYYEAEITGISENTCVVFFLGYGNHEEVLKTDCLPISDAQIRAINFGTTTVGVAIPQQQPPPGAVQLSAASRGLPNRYRSDRQMYVPPPKRDG